MSETFESIGQWGVKTFGGTQSHLEDQQRITLRVLEEAIEACYAAGVTWRQLHDAIDTPVRQCASKLKQISHDAVGEELADVIITANTGLAILGFLPEERVASKMARNRARTWKSTGQGTGQHVEDDAEELNHRPQRQDSLADQLRDLRDHATRLGMYDAADWLAKHERVSPLW